MYVSILNPCDKSVALAVQLATIGMTIALNGKRVEVDPDTPTVAKIYYGDSKDIATLRDKGWNVEEIEAPPS